MKKISMVLLATILISASCFAQKGKTQIGVGTDLSFPTGDFANYFKTGFGIYTKAMFGVSNSGQITFTGGYSNFKSIIPKEFARVSVGVIPLLVGYRHYFNGLFVEPQVGYAAIILKASDDQEYRSESGGKITWALGMGYVFNKKVEISARYQNSSSSEGNPLGMFGLRLGYNFSLKGSKK